MKTLPSLAYEDVCTGCGACYNSCLKNAIIMKRDKEGFLGPVVDTERCIGCCVCETVCPVLHPEYKNKTSPACFAMMARDEERANSSSGAFVPVVARLVFDRGGTVFGAVWDKDWSVKHIYAENMEEFEAIRGSKYAQSDVGLTYRQAYDLLKQEKWVLYTGTPCEIAALYGYLGKRVPTEKLITIDVVCHGAPSSQIIQKYLHDNYDIQKIKKFSCRDKSIYGWSISSSSIYTNDGKQLHETADKNIFMRAFNPCMIMRKACSTCPFSRLPRQGDFSCGDFWGVERYDADLTDKKGTSFVLVNNAKAVGIVNKLIPQLKLWKNVPLDAVTHINKTVLHPFRSHPGRKHFYSIIKNRHFNKVVEDSLSHHYDIGIVGLWYGINYGSILTYYALYSLLKELGYDPVMLPRPNILWEHSAKVFDSPDSIAQKFIWKHCNVFVQCHHQEEYYRFNDHCDSFILGSDVVWNYNVCGHDAGCFFFLDWVESGHKKIAYASSCGNGLSGPENYKILAKHYINTFDAVALRERYAVEDVRNITGRDDIVQVLDPVFMCNIEVYESIIKNIDQSYKNKIFCYVLNVTNKEEKKRLIQKICDVYHEANPFICGNPHELNKIKSAYANCHEDVISVEEWLYSIRNAKFYFVDSYHGLCFALIFHIPFLLMFSRKYKVASEQRFVSLLKLVGLESRLLFEDSDFTKVEDLIKEPIDWNVVDSRLDKAKEFSMVWLKNSLEKPLRNPVTAEALIDEKRTRQFNEAIIAYKNTYYEQVERRLKSQDVKIEKLNNKRLSRRIKNFFKRLLKNIE